jgi:transposase
MTTNSGLERNPTKILLTMLHGQKGGPMGIRIHGIDRHKHYSTIVVWNEEGKQEDFIKCCRDLSEYIRTLGKDDEVAIESSNGAFYWADMMEKRGATVYILDARKFKIIKDSWKKTDKEDAKNIVWALWVNHKSDMYGLPLVHKPDHRIRELRRLFAQYQLVNEQIVKLKTVIQANLSDVGIVLSDDVKAELFCEKKGMMVLSGMGVDGCARIATAMNLEMVWIAEKSKKALVNEILRAGEYLKESVELLISIKGVSPFIALAFLSDVGDITRFSNQKKLNAYLGLVPNAKSSGGKSRDGHINKASRSLTRWILTQSIPHIVTSSAYMGLYYATLKSRRGFGRSRIAVIRKIVGVMRRMLLNGRKYECCDEISHDRKINDYRKILKKLVKAA